MLGGIVAAYILHGLIPGETDINLKLSARANIAQGLFIETFATTTLILTVLMLGVGKSSLLSSLSGE
jgi:glycerol uptake facilitator-like aquaporin